jgi:DNA-binding CsgD family transcriptional regulator/predicted negative regulator of RcsB-dependent stress response
MLRACAAQAAAGTARVVLIDGAPGIGKSALVRRVLADSPVAKLLHASGDENEKNREFAILDQLLTLAGKRDADFSVAADPLTAGARFLEVLGGVQVGTALVGLVIDDAQWGDLASLQAITFALRRLEADRVLALICTRADDLGRLPAGLLHLVDDSPAGVHVRLRPLAASDVAVWATRLSAEQFSMAQARRLTIHTGGNPLHLQALFREVPPDGLDKMGGPWPAPASFAELVLSRLKAGAETVQALARATAVLGRSTPLALAARLSEVADPLAVAVQAAELELVTVHGQSPELQLSFPHPLVHATIYHAMGQLERSALHTRAGALVSDEFSRLRHLRAAASRPDTQLAQQLAEFAEQQARRGAWETAGWAFEGASQLCAESARSQAHVVNAAECRLLAGDVAAAGPLAAQIKFFGPSAQRSYLLGRVAHLTGQDERATQLLEAAWQAADLDADDSLRPRIAYQLAQVALLEGRTSDTVLWARRALLIGRYDAWRSFTGRGLLALGHSIGGSTSQALEVLRDLPDPIIDLTPTLVDDVFGRGVVRLYSDDLAGARRDLTAVIQACRHHGPFHQWISALSALSEVEYRAGNWDQALHYGQLSVEMALDADQSWMAATTNAIASAVYSGRGDWIQAQRLVDAATQAAQLTRVNASSGYAADAGVRLATARGDAAAVLDATAPLRQIKQRAGIDEPGVFAWRAAVVEALVSLGRLEEASRELNAVERVADDRARQSAQAANARARGLFTAAAGDRRAAEAALRLGLELSQRVDMPFEAARTRMELGRLLRRVGLHGQANAELELAQQTFIELDAGPFIGQCARELGGSDPASASHSVAARLTPQEAAIVRLIGAGKSNRDVATELIISIKTVEAHLTHIYRKLGVRSRTQLLAALSTTSG